LLTLPRPELRPLGGPSVASHYAECKVKRLSLLSSWGRNVAVYACYCAIMYIAKKLARVSGSYYENRRRLQQNSLGSLLESSALWKEIRVGKKVSILNKVDYTVLYQG
jgi:hypothetical protein